MGLAKKNWLVIVIWRVVVIKSCPSCPARTQTHCFSNQLGVTQESTDLFLFISKTILLRVFMLYINKELNHRVFAKILLCVFENNGRPDKQDYNVKCLALKEASCSWRKGLLTLFSEPCSPTFHPHKSSLPRSHLCYCSYCDVCFSQTCSPQTHESFLWWWLISESFTISCLVLWDQMSCCHNQGLDYGFW